MAHKNPIIIPPLCLQGLFVPTTDFSDVCSSNPIVSYYPLVHHLLIIIKDVAIHTQRRKGSTYKQLFHVLGYFGEAMVQYGFQKGVSH